MYANFLKRKEEMGKREKIKDEREREREGAQRR